MRIAFDTTALQLAGGGVATYTRELLSGLRLSPDTDVIELAHRHSASGTTIGRIAGGIDREARYYPYALAASARRSHADLVHSPAAMPVISPRLPLVITVHDAIPWRHPEWFTTANALHQRLLVSRAARRATRVITDSMASKADLVEIVGIDEARIDVIPLGVSPAFNPSLRDSKRLQERIGRGGPVVLSVGTPEPRKNLGAVLEAFDRVRREIPEATLLLVGDAGWRTGDLDARLARAGSSVIRAGRFPLDELARTYASADCFLFPSLREGFGLPPLEAMASGLPVVCSNRPSLPEVVGDAALTAEPDDHDALASAVVSILLDHARAADLRTRGLAQSASFTWSATVEQTIATYRRALR
jgi:glycosyltransferase involved in cell wall biosynthesis